MPIISIAVLILLQRSILRIVYKKDRRVVHRVITSDHFTKHPKENSLNIEEDLWWRPMELRAETSPWGEILTVRRRNGRSDCSQIFIKISVLKIWQYSQENTSRFLRKLLVLKPASLLKEDSNTTQVLSCEYCEIFKSSFFYRTPLVAASGIETFF